jgi:hypothetical protein
MAAAAGVGGDGGGTSLFVWAVGRVAGDDAMRAICEAARAGRDCGGGGRAPACVGAPGGGYLAWHAQDGRYQA